MFYNSNFYPPPSISRSWWRPFDIAHRRDLLRLRARPTSLSNRGRATRTTLQRRQSSPELRPELHVHAHCGYPPERHCRGGAGRRGPADQS